MFLVLGHVNKIHIRYKRFSTELSVPYQTESLLRSRILSYLSRLFRMLPIKLKPFDELDVGISQDFSNC